MNTRENIKLISKLNRETKEDKINWEITTSRINTLVGTQTLVNSIYFTKVLDKNIRLYKYKEKHFYDEDLFTWVESYRLEFFDYHGNSLYSFPEDRAIFDLYETVQFKTSNVEEFLKNYLEEEIDDIDGLEGL